MINENEPSGTFFSNLKFSSTIISADCFLGTMTSFASVNHHSILDKMLTYVALIVA
jgi:hypothetical protein